MSAAAEVLAPDADWVVKALDLREVSDSSARVSELESTPSASSPPPVAFPVITPDFSPADVNGFLRAHNFDDAVIASLAKFNGQAILGSSKEDVSLICNNTAEGIRLYALLHNSPGAFTRRPAKLRGEEYGQANDERVKTPFEIINPNSGRHLTAIVLIDTGAMSEITLPARKVVQLGLQPVEGAERKTKGSNNLQSVVLTLTPQVWVKGVLTRDNKEEEVKALLTCQVHKAEYDECKRDMANDAAPLSPVRHRGDAQRNERVVIGAKGLKELGFKVNVKDRCLEWEEVVLEEDSDEYL